MLNLDPITRTVYNILTRYGGMCTITISVPGPYDYETSTGTVTNTDYEAKMIAFDYLQRMQGTGFETNMLIRTGDKQLFVKMPEGMPMPKPGSDSVVYSGRKFNIITVKDLNPSGNSSFLLEMFVRE